MEIAPHLARQTPPSWPAATANDRAHRLSSAGPPSDLSTSPTVAAMDDELLVELMELPEIADFDDGECLLARVLVGRCRAGGAMIGGVLAEARVPVALGDGVEWPRFGTSPWDLRWRGISVQVRATTADGSFVLSGPSDVVFVFVDRDADRFIVVSGPEVAAIGRNSMRARKLAARFGACGAQDLAERIASVDRLSR